MDENFVDYHENYILYLKSKYAYSNIVRAHIHMKFFLLVPKIQNNASYHTNMHTVS